MEEKIFESLFIDVKFKNKTITFGCIYRAPCNDIISHSSFLDILNNTLKCIKKRDCFLLGDFNYNILDCEKPQITDFVDQMFRNGFAPLINKPTRISKNNATLLDHIWSNSLVSMKINCGVLTHCISDHLPVIMCTSISKISHQNVQQCRHFTDKNVYLFSKALSESDITPILCDSDPNSSYQKLQKLYMNKFENFFPLTKISCKKTNNQWFDSDLHILLNKKEKLCKRYINNKNPQTRQAFTQARNLYFSTVKTKKQEYYNLKFNNCKKDIKSTWKLINSIIGKKHKSNCRSLNIDGKIVHDPLKIANYFNKHFADVPNELVKSLPPKKKHFSEYLKSSTCQSMFTWPTCPQELACILKNSKNKLSAGPDHIPTKVLKSSPHNILLALSHVFNLSMSKGEFIDCFKLATVCPVFKKGDSNNINNYRPVSLLSNISKLLEKVMYNRLYSFLEKQNFFYNYQFGFRKNHSTTHAISILVEKISQSFSCKKATLGIFLDLSKAFDTIDHTILLSKLNHYGIRGNTLKWFTSYLTGRTQQVKYTGILSTTTLEVTSGVPQGSNLGPLLFLIYVNDFKNCLNDSDSLMFADDTSIFLQNKDIKELFDAGNKELQLVDQWLISNRLSVNVSKTKYILFKTVQSKLITKKQTLTLRQNEIEQVKCIKFLGVYMQEHLSWSRHINHLISKLRSVLRTVIKVKSLLNKRSLLLLYHSLINSQLSYCILNWCFGNKTLVKRLQGLCYKYVKLFFNFNSSSTVCDVMKENKLLTIDQLLAKELIVFMFKQKNGKNPSAFKDVFTKNESKYNTRNKSIFIPKKCFSTVCQQAISHRGPAYWNCIPFDLKIKTKCSIFYS